ncbi:hypothetical protein D9611_001189 [Ephemerocybe angulata]|uniref:Uncharacterized protein n=1 Tax=Ephemerocybe angulata TaxID=980116 RepID=A0A8H5CJR8_9AGAR|nr:hypothetical protein D9611_001189 [Tulosesus angulatus]
MLFSLLFQQQAINTPDPFMAQSKHAVILTAVGVTLLVTSGILATRGASWRKAQRRISQIASRNKQHSASRSPAANGRPAPLSPSHPSCGTESNSSTSPYSYSSPTSRATTPDETYASPRTPLFRDLRSPSASPSRELPPSRSTKQDPRAPSYTRYPPLPVSPLAIPHSRALPEDKFLPQFAPPELVFAAFDYQLMPYRGPPTQSFTASTSLIHKAPLALVISLNPSDDARVMQERYEEMCSFLTSPALMSTAAEIHSIDIIVPRESSANWNFESLPHPFDEGPTYKSKRRKEDWRQNDCMSPFRYKNQFPNLVEFGWDGMLGRRRGDGAYAALPAPFVDLIALPYAQLRRLELRHCLVTLSDCKHILRSAPRLRTFVVDTVVGVEPRTSVPGFHARGDVPALPRSSFPRWPLAAQALFQPLFPGDGTGAAPVHIECPELSILHVRTTVDLGHFFSTCSMPRVRRILYEPVGEEVGFVSVDNFPWNLNWESLESLALAAANVQVPVLDQLALACFEERVDWSFTPTSGQ